MPDIVTIGEVLIDFTEDTSINGEKCFIKNAGGSPANVAVMASKLNISTAFIGKVGKDIFGKYLIDVLKSFNVNTDGVVWDKVHPTTLAFVKNTEGGKRNFIFYRNDSADQNLSYKEINLKLIDSCKILHFGAFSLSKDPARSSIIEVVKYAKKSHKLISYSPNWRPDLWESKSEAETVMRSVLPLCDIIKVSEKELQVVTDSGNLITAIAKLLNLGISIVCITQGAKGCIIATRQGIERYPTYCLDTIDTLGAGDSFYGAFLSRFIKLNKKPDELNMSEITEIANYSNACGALTANKHGAIPAMPTHEEILNCIGTIKTY